MSIRVIKPGLLSTFQGDPRHGHARLGIGGSGPMDMPAFQLANALVGNPRGCAALELSLSGPLLQFDADTCIAVCGAEVDLRLDGDAVPTWCAISIVAGSTLDLSRFRRGARCVLAVAGGFDVDRFLGSPSADINAGLGPSALRAGDVLQSAPTASVDTRSPGPRRWRIDPARWFDADDSRPLRLIRGSHFNGLDAQSHTALFADAYQVSLDSNRVGVRLVGTTLRLREPLELVSEPVTAGTLQLPPGGQPIALMAEHPTTGGYPRIGQIAQVDLARLAQRRPGDQVRFEEATLDDAFALLAARERELAALLTSIKERTRR